MIEGNMEAFSKPIANCFVLPAEQDLKDECAKLIDGIKDRILTWLHSLRKNMCRI